VYTGFWWGNLRERDHLGDPDVDGRIILRWIFRKWDAGVMDWIDLAQDRDRWRALFYKTFRLAQGLRSASHEMGIGGRL
jgi:hypothetical protein